ncbi:MAG: YceI family protein [Acidimicrobiales bacterium]|nr:YceI family protein [Acidimicrobiales bacterium]
MDRRRLALVVIGVVAVAVIGWWFLLRSGAPPAPDLASAVEAATAAQTGSTVATSTTVTHPTTSSAYETTATTQAPVATTAPTTTTAVAAASTAGTWSVDTDIGSFSDFTSTWVGYRVQEVLGNGIGSATAVGRTPLVVGSVVLTDDAIEAVEVTADLRGLRSDKVYRDGKVRSALHADDHPTATFALVGPVTLGDLNGDGVSVDAVVPGTITINDMTGPVEVTLAATLVGDVVTVVGSFPIVFADHGIEAPGASIVVSVEDHGIVEFQLFLTR